MALLETLQDDFAFLDSSKWQQHNGGAINAYTTVVSGQLQQVTRSDYLANIESVSTYDFTGSYAYIQVVGRPTQGGDNSTEMTFGVSQGSDQTTGVVFTLTGGGGITWNQYVGNTDQGGGGFTTYDTVNHKFLRWRNSGTSIFGEASANGTTWTTLVTFTKASGFTITAVRAFMGTGYYGTQTTPGNALWDFFNTTTALSTFTPGTVVFDAFAQSNYTTALTNKTWSHTVGTGANRFALVTILWNQPNANETLGAVTFGGVAMTQIGSTLQGGQSSGGTNRLISFFGLVAPASGAQTVSVTVSASMSFVAESWTYSAVHQTTPTSGLSSYTTGTSTTTTTTGTVTVNSVANEQLVHVAHARYAGTFSAVPATNRFNTLLGSNNATAGGTTTGAATNTLTYTFATAGYLVIGAIAIKPAAFVATGNTGAFFNFF